MDITACEHVNCQEIEVGRHVNYVSHDMAMDGGDLALEGSPMDGGPEYALLCLDCNKIVEQ